MLPHWSSLFAISIAAFLAYLNGVKVVFTTTIGRLVVKTMSFYYYATPESSKSSQMIRVFLCAGKMAYSSFGKHRIIPPILLLSRVR